MPEGATLVWFRRDLRLRDNGALQAAIARGGPIVPVFVLDEAAERPHGLGGASRWWLHGSLAALAESLAERGSRLVLRRGDSGEQLRALLAETGARAIAWNALHEPALRRRDDALAAEFRAAGLEVTVGASGLLFDPDAVRTRGGGPFQVFSPFWRHCRALDWQRPEGERAPAAFPALRRGPLSDVLESWILRSGLPWAAGFGEYGEPGEEAARRRLQEFVRDGLDAYAEQRDKPACDGTSRLSAALHFGELSPRQVRAAVEAAPSESGVVPRSRGAQMFLDELGWREFAHHLLWHFPHTAERPLREAYASFPWLPDAAVQRAWQRGETGYPIVDAGLRQLWRTGWMHNRVRMIVASVFVKHLLQPWHAGAAWFHDTLVDADLANNTLGWQWSAGCGADAAPYFRVFNPVLQGEKFDAGGEYVRRWVPELARLPADVIHRPWEAEPAVLAAAGVRLGESYPQPLIEPRQGRERALAALAEWRRSQRDGAVARETGGRV
ncbi:MAG TPA: deoxyribodipyrimidine photo-lyase [Opitutaceae bacterium]|nr:deoxyribodipyrimidine photo-lyase [Opitutaceae bacterium]